MLAIARILDAVKDTSCGILLTGGDVLLAGTIARLIHGSSNRWMSGFIPVACERALYCMDMDAPAFLANQGTLFLENVDSLSLLLQSRLMEQLDQLPDVRVISHAQLDLMTMVGLGSFRADLFFRLAMIPVSLSQRLVTASTAHPHAQP